MIFVFEISAHEWTMTYSNLDPVSKQLNDYRNRKFYFNNDAEHKSQTSYEAAAETCGNKLVADFKTHFDVSWRRDGSFKVRVPGAKEERTVYDKSMENIKSVVLTIFYEQNLILDNFL